MALTCPQEFDVERLRDQVRATYSRVALRPEGQFHFHRGPEYASQFLSYDAAELAALPVAATARFAGVGNPLAVGPVSPGETVLDHACGAGMDLLLAARRVGATGRAIGIDMTPGMRAFASTAAREAGMAERVSVRAGLMEDLPVEDASVDLVISNGVLNLSPDKPQVFHEIMRVLKPGGRLYLADVVVARELTLEARSQPDLWAACIGGALQIGELLTLAEEAGMTESLVLQSFDCFRGTSAERKVSRDLGVHSVNFHARKPGRQS